MVTRKRRVYHAGLAANNVNPDAFFSPPPEAKIPHITELGQRFLRFITAPIPDLDSPDEQIGPSTSHAGGMTGPPHVEGRHAHMLYSSIEASAGLACLLQGPYNVHFSQHH